MGGFGAFDIARRHPHRFCAAGGHSPALWQSAGETAPGAFDDGADFGRHDVIRPPLAPPAAPYAGMPGCGWTPAAPTPSRPGCDRAFAAARWPCPCGPGWAATTAPTGTAHYRDYLRFYARVLAHCTPTAS